LKWRFWFRAARFIQIAAAATFFTLYMPRHSWQPPRSPVTTA